MSLLLTRHVDQYCIDIRRRPGRGIEVDRLCAAFLEPFADKVAVKTITLSHEHALHERHAW